MPPGPCAEAAGAKRGFLGEKLTVDPGRALRGDLRLDREVRSGGKRQAFVAAGIVIGPCFNDGARLGVPSHFQIGENEMVSPPVDRHR